MIKELKKLFLSLLTIIFFFTVSGCSQPDSNSTEIENIESSIFPYHEALGEAVGIYPGRVSWVFDKNAVDWDGEGYWWETSHFNETQISQMIETGIVNLTNSENINESWKEIFSYHNNRFSNNNEGYNPGQKLAIKVNINGSGVNDDNYTGETNLGYTNPVLLKSLLLSLVNNAGIKAEDITVYDVTRIFPTYFIEYIKTDSLENINFVDRSNAVKDENFPINWSYEFEGLTTYLPTCVTQADYLINLANLKGHSYGVTLAGKNLFGSIINENQIRAPEAAGLHQFLNNVDMNEYSPIIDLLGHEQIYNKTILYLLDALICAPSEGIEITYDNSRWLQDPFNNDFTSSIFFSQDSLALDSVGADFLVNEEKVISYNSVVGNNEASENYLHEGSQLEETPSGTVYQTVENTLSSLGVHEHWNNKDEKLYSKNLDSNKNGIELVFINLTDN